MKRHLDRLSRLFAPLRGAALAALATAVATVGFAEPASAQRRVGDVWQRPLEHGTTRRVVAPDACLPPGHRGPALGRYETRFERVWVPGRFERHWVPARYEWRFDNCGRRFQVLVCAGFWETVQHPGYYEQRQVRVWVPARVERPVRGHRVTQVGRRFR